MLSITKNKNKKLNKQKNDTDRYHQKQETMLIYLWIYACTRQERV